MKMRYRLYQFAICANTSRNSSNNHLAYFIQTKCLEYLISVTETLCDTHWIHFILSFTPFPHQTHWLWWIFWFGRYQNVHHCFQLLKSIFVIIAYWNKSISSMECGPVFSRIAYECTRSVNQDATLHNHCCCQPASHARPNAIFCLKSDKIFHHSNENTSNLFCKIAYYQNISSIKWLVLCGDINGS